MPADPSSKAIVDLYENNAHGWLEDRGTDLHERPWLDRLTTSRREGAAILDIGCGTGEPIARYLIECGFAVTGVDSSPALVAIASGRLPTGEWIVQDMRLLDLSRRFDALLAWNSFFHLSPGDQRAMFARFAAHARPGAPLRPRGISRASRCKRLRTGRSSPQRSAMRRRHHLARACQAIEKGRHRSRWRPSRVAPSGVSERS